MFAETIAWISIAILQLGLVFGSLMCFYKRNGALELIKSEGIGNNNHVNKFSMESYAGYMMAGGITLACMAFIFLVLLFFNFKHMKTAINVIDAAAEFMIGNKRVIFIPFIYFILTISLWISWAYAVT